METVIVELDRNSSGQPFIGATYIRNGLAYRASVLSHGSGITADSVMLRRFEDLCLMLKDDIQTNITEAFQSTYNPNPI